MTEWPPNLSVECPTDHHLILWPPNLILCSLQSMQSLPVPCRQCGVCTMSHIPRDDCTGKQVCALGSSCYLAPVCNGADGGWGVGAMRTCIVLGCEAVWIYQITRKVKTHWDRNKDTNLYCFIRSEVTQTNSAFIIYIHNNICIVQ